MTFGSSLRGSYWPTVAITLLALAPNFVLSTALGLVRPAISESLDGGLIGIFWTAVFGNAALAVGAVVAADLAQRLDNRPLFLVYEGTFVLGSLLSTFAPSPGALIFGHVLQGLCTGLLLVATLPPLVTGFPVGRLKTTIPVAVIGLFGAVTAGPLVGGLVAQTGTWRWMFGATAVLGLAALLLSLFVLPGRPPLNPGARVDVSALMLSVLGTGFAFYGVGQLMRHEWSSPFVYVPAALGVLLLVALVVLEALREEPLMPAKTLFTTFPVMGILAAVISGAAFTAMLQLRILYLSGVRGSSPLETGMLFWPDLAAGIVGAMIVGVVLTTRMVLVMPLFGMLTLALAAWLLTGVSPETTNAEVLWISGLLGLGASLTVTPGMLMAALSVTPALVGRAIALVQLLRLTGAYLLAPVLVYFATARGMQSQQLLAGLHATFSVVLWLLLAGIAGITLVYLVGGAHLQPPGLVAFLERDEPALESPPIKGKSG